MHPPVGTWTLNSTQLGCSLDTVLSFPVSCLHSLTTTDWGQSDSCRPPYRPPPPFTATDAALWSPPAALLYGLHSSDLNVFSVTNITQTTSRRT